MTERRSVPGYLLAQLLLPWTRGVLRVLVAFILGTTLCFAILFGLEFPNYCIKDILTDTDYYGGVAVARIVIE